MRPTSCSGSKIQHATFNKCPLQLGANSISNSEQLAERFSRGKPPVRLARRALQAIGDGCSEPFLFQIVHVEPMVHDPVTRNELLDVILHVLLEFQR